MIIIVSRTFITTAIANKMRNITLLLSPLSLLVVTDPMDNYINNVIAFQSILLNNYMCTKNIKVIHVHN